MGQPLPPRIITAGAYQPSAPRIGSNDVGAFRMDSLIVRGRGDRCYWSAYSGEGDLAENVPMVALTGTLSLAAGSITITGVGTLFQSEAHLGETIVGILNNQSWLLKPRRIISDTSMVVWAAPATTITLVVGWRMARLYSINDQRGTSLWGNAIKRDKGSYIGCGDGTFRVNGTALNATWALARHPSISLFDPTSETYTNFPLGMNTSAAPVLAGVGTISISSATNANPVVFTTGAAHGLTTGERYTISGATIGWTGVNGVFVVTVLSTTTFSIPVNSTGFGALSGTLVVSGAKGMQAGSYSLVITPARKQTGGYNNPSLRADVTLAADDLIRITFPAMDTAHGQNSWKVWVTTFSDTLGADLNYLNGPWHFYIEVTDAMISNAGGVYVIEYLDAEVEGNELVSFNNDAPTDAEFVATLNDGLVYISCQGQGNATNPAMTSPGPFIVPSKPNNIEAAPLDLAFSSSPPETILGVVSAQGRLYLLTFNHLQIAQSTPDDNIPIIIRPFWRDGFTGPDQLVFVNGTLYGYPVAGPSRSVGDGDVIEAERDWAADVSEITDDWNPGHVTVGYDPFRDVVIFIHSADHLNPAGFWTSRMLGFGISQGFWVFDRIITSNTHDCIVSGVATVSDRMELLIGGRGAANTVTGRFNAGTGSTWNIVAPVSDNGSELRSTVIKAVSVKGKLTSASAKIYGFDVSDPVSVSDLESGLNSSSGSVALANTTQVAQSERQPVNIPNCALSTVRIEGSYTVTPGVIADRIDSINLERGVQGVRR